MCEWSYWKDYYMWNPRTYSCECYKTCKINE